MKPYLLNQNKSNPRIILFNKCNGGNILMVGGGMGRVEPMVEVINLEEVIFLQQEN